MFMQYRNCLIYIYDASSGNFIRRSYAPAIFARAAANELTAKSERFPNEKRYEEAAQRLHNKEYREFVPLIKEATINKGQLLLKYGPNSFVRTSGKSFVYNLKLAGGDTHVSLILKSSRDPFVYDMRHTIPIGKNAGFQGYAFPSLTAAGHIEEKSGKRKLSGVVWFTHFWGDTITSDYTFISQRLDNGSALQAYAFYPDGKSANAYAVLLKPDGTMSEIKDFRIEKDSLWKSPESDIEYPVSWRVKSRAVSGKVAALRDNFEISVAEGRGALWHGPCSFTGNISGKHVTGQGVCRSLAPDTRK